MLPSTYYNKFWNTAIEQFQTGKFDTDPLIDAPLDTRFGISLILRPSAEVKAAIHRMTEAFRAVDPRQYYYPRTDIHVTILSVVSCYAGFNRSAFTASDYIDVVQQSLKNTPAFNISFKGITATPGCVMVQGFAARDLNLLRRNLRNRLNKTTLETSFDKRYTLKVAHATVVRFKKNVHQKDNFLELLEHYRHHDFGTCLINKVELVYNDWYVRKKKVEILACFNLPAQAACATI